MNKESALKVICWIAVLGMAFSGYLSYGELFAQSCSINGGCSSSVVAGIPACVYGFVMYAIVLVIGVLGLKSGK